MTKTTRLIWSLFTAELIGTFLLIVIGDGVIASYVLTKQKVDLFCACLAFGLGAMVAAFATARISGAHLNPAVTVAFALAGKLKWKLVPIYVCAQYLGGFLGALALFINNAEAIGALDEGARSAFGSDKSTGFIFATYPGAWVSVWGSLLDQILGTAVLVFALTALADKRNLGLDERHQPVHMALVIGIVCLAFQPNCGAIFNPARDLAPRLLTALFGYPDVWAPVGGLYWLMAGVVGPHVGAIVGVFVYKLLISRTLEESDEYELESVEAAGGCCGCHSAPGAAMAPAGQPHKPKAGHHQPHHRHHHHHPDEAPELGYGSGAR